MVVNGPEFGPRIRLPEYIPPLDLELFGIRKMLRAELKQVVDEGVSVDKKEGSYDSGLECGEIYSYKVGDGLSFVLDIAPVEFLNAYERNNELVLNVPNYEKVLKPGDIALLGGEVDFEKDIELKDISIAPRHLKIKYLGNGRVEVVNLDDRKVVHGVRVKPGKFVKREEDTISPVRSRRSLISGERFQPGVEYLIHLEHLDSAYFNFLEGNESVFSLSREGDNIEFVTKNGVLGSYPPDSSFTLGSGTDADIRVQMQGLNKKHLLVSFLGNGMVVLKYLGKVSEDSGMRYYSSLPTGAKYRPVYGEIIEKGGASREVEGTPVVGVSRTTGEDVTNVVRLSEIAKRQEEK